MNSERLAFFDFERAGVARRDDEFVRQTTGQRYFFPTLCAQS
jgi:hypothetical protein